MAVDSMNKVIHAAVRRDLRRLEHALTTVRNGDRRRAGDLRRAWEHLDSQLHHHHDQEEALVFPAVVGLGIDPALVEEMESEHDEMVRALEDIDHAVRAYSASATVADAAAAAEAVRRGSVSVQRHLAHEEAELEPALRPHVGSAEWKAVEKQLRKQPPTKAGWFFAWLEDGASDDVRAYLGSTVPGPVRFVFSRAFGRGYHRAIAPVWR